MELRNRIEQKLADLRQQYKQLVDNGNAVSGAIQVCEQLLADEETPGNTINVEDLTWIGPGSDPRLTAREP